MLKIAKCVIKSFPPWPSCGCTCAFASTLVVIWRCRCSVSPRNKCSPFKSPILIARVSKVLTTCRCTLICTCRPFLANSSAPSGNALSFSLPRASCRHMWRSTINSRVTYVAIISSKSTTLRCTCSDIFNWSHMLVTFLAARTQPKFLTIWKLTKEECTPLLVTRATCAAWTSRDAISTRYTRWNTKQRRMESLSVVLGAAKSFLRTLKTSRNTSKYSTIIRSDFSAQSATNASTLQGSWGFTKSHTRLAQNTARRSMTPNIVQKILTPLARGLKLLQINKNCSSKMKLRKLFLIKSSYCFCATGNNTHKNFYLIISLRHWINLYFSRSFSFFLLINL